MATPSGQIQTIQSIDVDFSNTVLVEGDTIDITITSAGIPTRSTFTVPPGQTLTLDGAMFGKITSK